MRDRLSGRPDAVQLLDEPTDLPEGESVELVALDGMFVDDGVDDQKRPAIHRELERSIAEANAGPLVSAADMFAELAAIR